MRKIHVLLAFTLLSMSSFGQIMQPKKAPIRDTTPQKQVVKTFDLIHGSFDLSGKTKISSLTGNSIDICQMNLSRLFNSFWINANRAGSNACVIDSIIRSGDTTYVVISTYYLDEAELKTNADLYPRNAIYVIGDIDKRQTEKYIKFNSSKIELNPLEYVSYQNQVGQEAVISIGGLLGAKMWIMGKENRLPTFLSVNGFGIGGGSVNPVSISFNTGRIYPVDFNFGCFLICILKEKAKL